MPAPVHVICQNYQDDRVLPRFARALAEWLGWSLSTGPSPAEVTYLMGYFEGPRVKAWPNQVAALFTHKEEEPPNNAKARLFDRMAAKVQLRTCWADMYVEMLSPHGPTVKVSPGLERDHFTLTEQPERKRLMAGFAGYTYRNHRKGEDLVREVLAHEVAQEMDWRASGRGWPVATKRYDWADMPAFFQSLDILVVPSRVEGIPMPPLEALACGVSVVIPRHVGMLDELPDLPGIHRYERGDVTTLLKALKEASEMRHDVDREALREVTAPYSMEQWCDDHAVAIEETFGIAAGVAPASRATYEPMPPKQSTGKRGIYLVAFGDPARESANELMDMIGTHMPDVPIALCADKPIGPEAIWIEREDTDIGAREAKLSMYDLSPQDWDTVLYMDADIEMVAPVYQYFEWCEDGWDMVATKDPHLVDTMQSYERPNNKQDMASIRRAIGTTNALQVAGGVMCFRRNERVKAFFDAWLAEWRVHKQRDQGPLIRALYQHPLKLWLLGSEWNTFLRYMKADRTAGLIHYPGKARRWRGLVNGPLDGDAAWRAVARHESRQKQAPQSRRQRR